MTNSAAARRIQNALASGRHHLHVEAPGTDAVDMSLAIRDDLVLRVSIRGLDRIAQLDLGPQFLHFLESGRDQGSYTEDACLTIEKFGTPIQFKESIHVRFRTI